MQNDRILEYPKALLFGGLCNLAYRDAIGEGDGKAILGHWKTNLIQFHNNNHYKYFNLAPNMLVCINGFNPSKIAKEMTELQI